MTVPILPLPLPLPLLMLLPLPLLSVPEAQQFLCFSHSTEKAAALQRATLNKPK
jgi:hypothetical protein